MNTPLPPLMCTLCGGTWKTEQELHEHHTFCVPRHEGKECDFCWDPDGLDHMCVKKKNTLEIGCFSILIADSQKARRVKEIVRAIEEFPQFVWHKSYFIEDLRNFLINYQEEISLSKRKNKSKDNRGIGTLLWGCLRDPDLAGLVDREIESYTNLLNEFKRMVEEHRLSMQERIAEEKKQKKETK